MHWSLASEQWFAAPPKFARKLTMISDENKRGRHVLRSALWLCLILFWIAYGISVSTALLLNVFSDPRIFYNYFVGNQVDPSVPVVEANSMHVSRISIAALIVVAVIALLVSAWRRTTARQSCPSCYAAFGLLVSIPLGLALSVATPIEYVRDYAAYLKLAQSLYSTGDYSDFSDGNFSDPNPDTLAWRPPGPALLYGLPIHLGIPTQASVWLINSLIVIIIFLFVRSSLYRSQLRAPAWLVAFAGLVICFATLPFLLLPIAHPPVIATLALLLLLVPIESSDLMRLNWSRWLLAGLLIGISALFRPNLVLLIAILGVAVLVRSGQLGGRPLYVRSATALSICAIGLVIAIGPWTIRNWFTLHRLVPISTNGGMVFYSANGSANPTEQGRYISRLAIQLFKEVPNEVDRDHEGWKRGAINIAQHPGTFAKSFIYRVPRLLANPLYSVSYIRDQARDRSWIWVLYLSETATLIAFWWLWLDMFIYRRAIRERLFDTNLLPWPQFSLLVTAFISSLFENSPTFQLSFLPFILFIWFDASSRKTPQVSHTAFVPEKTAPQSLPKSPR
jgi:hypothetical protein